MDEQVMGIPTENTLARISALRGEQKALVARVEKIETGVNLIIEALEDLTSLVQVQKQQIGSLQMELVKTNQRFTDHENQQNATALSWERR